MITARHEEIIKPDLVVGFAQLAPFVTAANAHLKHGAIDDAKKCLEQACKVIDLATMTVIFSPLANKDTYDSSTNEASTDE